MAFDRHQEFTHWSKTQPYTQGLLQRGQNNSYSDNQLLVTAKSGQCDKVQNAGNSVTCAHGQII